jgi:hypothetical protein
VRVPNAIDADWQAENCSGAAKTGATANFVDWFSVRASAFRNPGGIRG